MEYSSSDANLGRFVRIRQGQLGIGKLVAVNGDEANVEHFVSVNDRRRGDFPLSLVEPASLPPQTRVYVRQEDRWRSGRSIRHLDRQVEVALPGGEVGYFEESLVFARSELPGEDPVQTLLSYGHDTPYYCERRAAFVRYYAELRNAWRGLDAFAAARVEVFAHQLEVVHRVLNDPVQRYLLADEVGLGKTVEAGIILRQMLMDDPDARALIVVPPPLVEQWRHELIHRIGLADDAERFTLLGADKLDALEDLAAGVGFDMIIVDEAHHVAAGAPDAPLFSKVKRLAHASPRLLLLSATPVLNHEGEFLAMLHLLDPDVYRLDGQEAFAERVRRRQEVGGVLVGMKPNAPSFVLKNQIGKMRALFPHDGKLTELLDSCETADAQSRAAAVAAVRVHVSETYRLHRRLLRNRRAAILARPEAVLADRCTPAEEEEPTVELAEMLTDPRAEDVERALESWRAAAAAVEDNVLRARLAEIYEVFLQASGTWWGVLAAAVRTRIGVPMATGSRILASAFDDLTADLLQGVETFAGEEDLLAELRLACGDGGPPTPEDRLSLAIAVIYKLLRGKGVRRVVVFTGFTPTAQALLRRLRLAAGGAVGVYELTNAVSQTNEFIGYAGPAVLVCDRAGEEGHNLQVADAVVHVDVPLSPLRLEQRIGRVDRIGRGKPARTRVLWSYDEDSAAGLWLRLLADGLGIFCRSAADLQFYLDAAPRRWAATLFEHGPEALDDLIGTVVAEVAEERNRVEEQAAVDEIEAAEEGSDGWFSRLVQVEEDETPIVEGFERWLRETLQFYREDVPGRPDVLRYHANYFGSLPDGVCATGAGRTLVPADLWRAWPGRGDCLTYSRIEASMRPEVRLLRPGEPFVEELARYVEWDDRGRSFAMYRHDRRLRPEEGQEWVGYRFDLLVEADTSTAESALEELAESHGRRSLRRVLRRRSDALMPPAFHTVYVDYAGSPVTDPLVLEILRRPYEKRRQHGSDTNLQDEHLHVLKGFIDPASWAEHCRSMSALVSRHALDLPDAAADRVAAVERASREAVTRAERLRLRASWQADAAAELRLEEKLTAPMIVGLERPRVRVDSVGLYVLSGNDRFAPIRY